MDKTATLNLRVNPQLKKDAESILNRLGIPMSTAIDIFLNQIVLVEGIPFPVQLPKAPASVDLTGMTEEEIHARIMEGYNDYKAGKTSDAKKFFDKIRNEDKSNLHVVEEYEKKKLEGTLETRPIEELWKDLNI